MPDSNSSFEDIRLHYHHHPSNHSSKTKITSKSHDLIYWKSKLVPKNKSNLEYFEQKLLIKLKNQTIPNANNSYQSKTNGTAASSYTTHMNNVLPTTKKIFIKYGTIYSQPQQLSIQNLSLEHVTAEMQQKKWFLNAKDRH
jgi:hypothetical protein